MAAMAALLAGAAPACAGRAGNADLAWRDQYLFIGDDGTVIPLVLQRTGAGAAEAKGWVGGPQGWQGRLYHRYRMASGGAASVAKAVAALAGSPHTPVRGRLTGGDGVDLELRLRDRVVHIVAPALQPLGRAEDPEGVSLYRAGRASLRSAGRDLAGWLVVEETPPDRPRRAFIDYGDFLFAAVATRERVLVVKRSLTRAGFDHRFALSGDRGPDLELAAARVIDRDVTRGVNPAGDPVRFEVLLLGGDVSGVAFTIRPDGRMDPWLASH